MILTMLAACSVVVVWAMASATLLINAPPSLPSRRLCIAAQHPACYAQAPRREAVLFAHASLDVREQR